ncbi:MAG: DNA replication and repair protein RecF, partial [Gammaproteobacteria bacterium]|nr:DNA replication and repair protein RecF [Gammaproteobacteria bacterium]
MLAGPNASGKTSFLEAIHYLALGRSFRTSSVKPLIRIGDDETVLFTELSGGTKIGLHRTRKGDQQLKSNGLVQRSWEGVAREIPIQLLDATSFSLLNEGPRLRRRFLDWGVFHVEQQFLPAWRRTRKSIMHRNALLKRAGRMDEEQLAAWKEELVSGAMEITGSRERYFLRLQEAFSRALST